MKKHLFLSLISLSLILCLTACSNSKNNEKKEKASLVENNTTKTGTTTNAATTSSTTPSSIVAETESKHPVTETVDQQVIDLTNEETINIMKTYQSVLHDETEFFEVYADNKISTFSQMMHTMDDKLSLVRFAVIDLDGDNRMEFIISIDSGELHDIVFLIFHYEDKKVYEYTLAYRQFEGLKIDGTFNVSGGHTNHGIGTLSFQKNGSETASLITDKFTYITDETADDESESGLSVFYYVNHALSTKAEFDKALTTQGNKPDAVWYDFTEENMSYFKGESQ